MTLRLRSSWLSSILSMRWRSSPAVSCGGSNRHPVTLPIFYNDDPFVIVNMSVWESLESLRDYVYTSKHVELLRDRAKWFEKMEKPHYCLWWAPAGHVPTMAEGRERLEHYQRHGATEFSFWFSQRYPAPADQEVFA